MVVDGWIAGGAADRRRSRLAIARDASLYARDAALRGDAAAQAPSAAGSHKPSTSS